MNENDWFSIEKYSTFNSFMHRQITVKNAGKGVREVLAAQTFLVSMPPDPPSGVVRF